MGPSFRTITGHLTGRINYISNFSLALSNSTRVFSTSDLSEVEATQREGPEGYNFCTFTLFDYIQILL